MRLPFLSDRREAEGPAREPTTPVEERQSRAFDAAIEVLRALPDRRVLDLGAASGENVHFFSGVECQLEILDLYPQLVERPDRLARTHESFAIGHLISRILEERPGRSKERPEFELILAWDLLDFLSPEQIRGLILGLEPYTHPGTRLLALVSYLGTVPSAPRHVKVRDQHTLAVHAKPGHRSSPRYTEPQLLKVMPGWEVDRCFLQRDGFREYVFIRS